MPKTDSSTTAKRANQAGRPTAAELERRKARVMQVATDLFIRNGFAGTSLIDIARQAGVASRTLYQHFGDKEALFREVIYARDTQKIAKKPRVHDGDTLFEAVMRAANYAVEVTYQPYSIGLMQLMIAERTRFPDFMKQIANAIYARFQRNLESVFTDLELRGAIPHCDQARSARLFSDIVCGSGPLMTYTDWQADNPTREDIENRVETFLRGRFGDAVLESARTRIVHPGKHASAA